MKKVNLNNILLIAVLFSLLNSTPQIKHGFSTAITNNGQRILYSNEIKYKFFQIYCNIGLHNETRLSINHYNQLESNSINSKNYIPINLGLKKNMFSSGLHGNIKPYIFTEFGELFSIKKFNLNRIKLIDANAEISFGSGLCYKKIKSSQYLYVGFTSNHIIDGSLIFGYKIIWN